MKVAVLRLHGRHLKRAQPLHDLPGDGLIAGVPVQGMAQDMAEHGGELRIIVEKPDQAVRDVDLLPVEEGVDLIAPGQNQIEIAVCAGRHVDGQPLRVAAQVERQRGADSGLALEVDRTFSSVRVRTPASG